MPDAEPAAESLTEAWSAGHRAVAAAQRAVLAEVAASGVPAQWFAVLRMLYLAPGGRLAMSQVARELDMTSGGFTKLADRMAREGLIDRRGASTDRRVVHAALTDHGRALARAALTIYDEQVRAIVLDALTSEDIASLVRIAGKLRTAIQPDAEPADSPVSDRWPDVDPIDTRSDGPPPRRRRTDC